MRVGVCRIFRERERKREKSRMCVCERQIMYACERVKIQRREREKNLSPLLLSLIHSSLSQYAQSPLHAEA